MRASCFIFALISCNCGINANAIKHVFTEDFANRGNKGGWSFGKPGSIVVDEQGKSSLEVQEYDAWGPILHTTSTHNPFVGDYRKTHVTELSIQTKYDAECFNPRDERPLSLVLIHGNYAAYQISQEQLRNAHLNWHTFEFQIPQTSTQQLELGWKVVQWPEVSMNADPNLIEEILKDVQEVRFYYADPTSYYIFQYWTVNATNIKIVRDF